MRATLTATLLFLLVVVPAAGGQEPRIAGFAANLPGSELDDAVWIHNPSAAALPLDGLELSDNSGRIAFPGGAVLPAGATAIVAGNATAWLEAAGNWPDYAIQGLSADRTMRTAKQGFALGQDGDSLSLLDGAEVLDSVAYGDARSLPTGWTGPTVDVAGGNFMRWFPRAAGPDTNAAAEWEGPRRRILGQDTFAPVIVPFSGEVVAFLAPDHARAIVELAFGLASSHLRLNVYELRDLPVAWGLADRLGSRPDLRLDVLVDAAPVGETSAEHNERGHAIRALEEAGATIHVMQHVRYGFDHAKYAVVDERFALVQSENLVPSGIPQDHASGNRGWGVYIANATLARMLAEVFDADFALRPHGARLPSTDDSPTFEPPLTPFYAKPMRGQPLVDSTPGTATLLASPLEPTADDPVVTVLRGARESIRVAQLNFPPVWRDATSTAISLTKRRRGGTTPIRRRPSTRSPTARHVCKTATGRSSMQKASSWTNVGSSWEA
ncbi:MAG: lamin tail domain-containing protein [Euryarchaeota archaeon]|nr:lamin tail domain-containing protein [Euryarchaeota archaeon]